MMHIFIIAPTLTECMLLVTLFAHLYCYKNIFVIFRSTAMFEPALECYTRQKTNVTRKINLKCLKCKSNNHNAVNLQDNSKKVEVK